MSIAKADLDFNCKCRLPEETSGGDPLKKASLGLNAPINRSLRQPEATDLIESPGEADDPRISADAGVPFKT